MTQSLPEGVRGSDTSRWVIERPVFEGCRGGQRPCLESRETAQSVRLIEAGLPVLKKLFFANPLT